MKHGSWCVHCLYSTRAVSGLEQLLTTVTCMHVAFVLGDGSWIGVSLSPGNFLPVLVTVYKARLLNERLLVHPVYQFKAVVETMFAPETAMW